MSLGLYDVFLFKHASTEKKLSLAILRQQNWNYAKTVISLTIPPASWKGEDR